MRLFLFSRLCPGGCFALLLLDGRLRRGVRRAWHAKWNVCRLLGATLENPLPFDGLGENRAAWLLGMGV